MLAYLLLANMSYYLILMNIFSATIKWYINYLWCVQSVCQVCFFFFNQIPSIYNVFAVMALNHLNLLRPLLCQSLARHARPPLTVTSWIGFRPPTCLGTSLHPAPACIRLYATKKAKGQYRHWSSDLCNIFTSPGSVVSLLIRCYLSYIWVLFSPFSSSKPRQRASQLRWILIQPWWKTSSVWMKWRRTWLQFSVHLKMSSHATSASEPRQVVGLCLLDLLTHFLFASLFFFSPGNSFYSKMKQDFSPKEK